MTVEEIVNEINWIKNDINNCQRKMDKTKSKRIKAECRAKLYEHRHQLMHLESILIAIKYDPLF